MSELWLRDLCDHGAAGGCEFCDGSLPRKRGRPRKARPLRGDDLKIAMSERDIAATAGISRHPLQQMKALDSIPEEEFDTLIESDHPPTVTELVRLSTGKLAERPTRKIVERELKCPQCGHLLLVESEA